MPLRQQDATGVCSERIEIEVVPVGVEFFIEEGLCMP